MTYKAFNTFVDDVFAILVSMPMHHKIACLRDDAVFVVFLIQRWLYPVDKTRANEYGIAYEHEEEDAGDDHAGTCGDGMQSGEVAAAADGTAPEPELPHGATEQDADAAR